MRCGASAGCRGCDPGSLPGADRVVVAGRDYPRESLTPCERTLSRRVVAPLPHRARRSAGAGARAAPGAGRGDPGRAGHQRRQDRWAPRAEPGRRRADHRRPPGLRLPPRAGGLRHRSPVLRPQAAHRPAGGLRRPAPPRWPVRLPLPGGERARLGREQPRLDVAVLRRRAGQGLRRPRGRPAGGGGHRRRRAHRRHGLGGAEQHRRRPGPAGGHRGQRQRPLVLPDHRWRGRRAGHPAAAPGLRAGAARRPAVGDPCPGGGHRAVRRAARDQEGPQGRPVPAGHVRGPGHEVRRPGRRPRHRRGGVRAAPGPLVRWARHRARGDHQGLRLRPGAERHHRRLARHRRLRPRLRGQPGQRRPGLDDGVLRRAGRGRVRAVRRRGHHRRDAAPHRAGRVRQHPGR